MAAVRCQLAKVVMSEHNERQAVVLQEVDGTRQLSILIGFFEVFAIHRFVNDEAPQRPFTHELIGNICRGLNVTEEKVVVNDLRDMTFYARLFLRRNGETVDVDSRPSDAIALAVQMGAPIFVEEEVLEKATKDFS